MTAITIEITDELVEKVARRAADLMAVDRPVDIGGYMDVAGAADFLSCPVSRIYALVSAKRIPFHKDGSRLLFDRAELRAYVDAGGAVRP